MKENSETVQDEEQKLLSKLIKQGVLEFTPTLNKTGIRYVEVEETWKNDDPTQVKGTLENLERKGALVSTFMDRILTCPDCDSPQVYSKYACPKCDSINVEYTELLEHMKCGYMGSKNKFIKGSSLICPGCQAELVDEAVQYRVIGNCYQCEKCGHRFDAPKVIHFCQQCQKSFTYREAKYIKIYTYKISDQIMDKFAKDLPLFESVAEILREKKFDTQFHVKLTGTSGVQHPFDIVAKRKDILLVANVSLSGDTNDAVSLFGKKMDINPTAAFLIDLSDHKELLSLGKVYGITILKGGNEEQLKKGLRDSLAILGSNRN
jgi:uncharacterized OB-fold protein